MYKIAARTQCRFSEASNYGTYSGYYLIFSAELFYSFKKCVR